ncbi:MAG: protein MpaA [Thermoproteota archaeon]|jgi:protein MpaA
MIFNDLPDGVTVQGEPIKAYKTDIKAKKYIYLLAGTHGDEVEGVFVLQQLFNWLKENHELSDHPIIVVPILNVDGYQALTRVNAHAVDLNRNMPSNDWCSEFKKKKYNPGPTGLSEPENVYLDKLFKQYKPSVVLSFHSWKPLLNYNGDCSELANYIGKFNKYPVEDNIGYSTPGSLGTYVPEKYDAAVLTYECPPFSDELSLKKIWEENEIALKTLFEEDFLLTKYKQ